MAVKGAQGWSVVIHDHMNSSPSIAYAIQEAFGIPFDRGLELVDEVIEHGHAELAVCAQREQAEQLVAHLQVLGVVAGLRGC
ncbi:hypothetical protein GCM10017786_56380 [Amycolatopsis deserti]|uniref:ATP-dependent Clp protease adaptor protein ClpS n=1 Tax=Amycolatopsis deserti TaxID=185696 RepID=A0ABQ3JFS4_9PSEU|nr:ATP-dependent Clp protease adaptor ClpS [Amycolatopsis deserti]GHF15342.1 hypothetical protein GCM10017786_56380 [Amycolatopsis deserti]